MADSSFPFDPSWLTGGEGIGTAGTTGGIDWGSLLGGIGSAVGTGAAYAGPILSIIQGLSTGPYGDIPMAQQAAGLADPFASQRGQYQQQLQGLLTDPNSFKQDPGYQFAVQQGQDAIAAKSAALYGTERTGSLAPELAKYTEGYANQAYNDRINQLMQLSGANTGSPSAAGGLLMQGAIQQGQDVGMGLQTLANLLKPNVPQTVNINQSTGGSATGGAGGSGGSSNASPWNEVPYGGSGASMANLLGNGPGSVYDLLGLGNTGVSTSPWSTDPNLARYLNNIFGTDYAAIGRMPGGGPPGGAPPTTGAWNPLSPGGPLSFGATQGGGFAGLIGGGGSGAWNEIPNFGGGGTSGWNSGFDLPGGGDTGNWWDAFTSGGSGIGDSIDWGSLLSGGSAGDWSSLFGG